MIHDSPWAHAESMAPGSKARLLLTFPDAVLSGIEIPCVVVRGQHEGPLVSVVGGIHGGEYPGPAAAIRLSREIDPSALAGTQVIIPIANPTSFRERTAFVTPDDGVNLAGVFPGDPDGTFSQVLAFRLFEQVVRPAEISIDLHSGDVFESLRPYTGFHDSNDPSSRALAERIAGAFDVPLLIYVPGLEPPGHSLSKSAAIAGLASVFTEIGCNGLLSSSDEATTFNGLINALIAAGSLTGDLAPSTASIYCSTGLVTASVTGLWRREIELDAQVEAGQTVGVITDAFGDELERVIAPASGEVMYFLSSLSVREGDALVSLAGPINEYGGFLSGSPEGTR